MDRLTANGHWSVIFTEDVKDITDWEETNAEQRQTVADLWTKPTAWATGPPVARRLWNAIFYIHHRHLLLAYSAWKLILILPSQWSNRGQKAELVDLDGCYIPIGSQAVTHPSSNRAQCRLTTLTRRYGHNNTPPPAHISVQSAICNIILKLAKGSCTRFWYTYRYLEHSAVWCPIVHFKLAAYCEVYVIGLAYAML